MLITILGRQPELSLAELESRLGADKLQLLSDQAALLNLPNIDIDTLGGCLKIAQLDHQFANTSKTKTIQAVAQFYQHELSKDFRKLTLGVSWYTDNPKVSPRDAQLIGLKIKGAFKRQRLSLRLVPNQETTLSTATTFHNKLGTDKKVEIIIVETANQVFVGRLIGSQDINAYTRRDRERPKRDARVGMLPPKLAQIIINLAAGSSSSTNRRLLDPFCGTGVILQEAGLLGFEIYGSDLEPRMIDFSRANLRWLDSKLKPQLEVGDATRHRWQPPIDLVASEIFLGKPFGDQPTKDQILAEKVVVDQLLTNFLTNLAAQIKPDTRICLAVPAWQALDGQMVKLSTSQLESLTKLGYKFVHFKHVDVENLIYHRPEQAVGRQLLVLSHQA